MDGIVIDLSREIYAPATVTPVRAPSPLPYGGALDAVVFDAIGLRREGREEVYRAVYQLVKNRLVRARRVRSERERGECEVEGGVNGDREECRGWGRG